MGAETTTVGTGSVPVSICRGSDTLKSVFLLPSLWIPCGGGDGSGSGEKAAAFEAIFREPPGGGAFGWPIELPIWALGASSSIS